MTGMSRAVATFDAWLASAETPKRAVWANKELGVLVLQRGLDGYVWPETPNKEDTEKWN